MSLRRGIEFIRQNEKELVLFNFEQEAAIEDELSTYFQTQNVQIQTERTASGNPADIAVLSSQEEVLTRTNRATLRELIDEVPTGSGGVGIDESGFEAVLGPLKETTFTAYDKQQLLQASREIEDRAMRVGRGTLHAGFQRLSLLDEQRSMYADLARRGVEIHAYGIPDMKVPEIGTGTVHAAEADEIAEMWFLVFDGGGKDTQKTALLAEQRGENSFYGAWTYDPEIVDTLFAHLEDTYVSPSNATRTESR